MNAAKEAPRADCDMIDRFLQRLSDKIGPGKFNAWFRNGTRIGLDDSSVKVTVPNPFVASWIESHYQDDIAAAAGAVAGARRTVIVLIDPSLSGQLRQRQLDVQADLVTKAGEGRTRPRPAATRGGGIRHSLKDFVVGQSNRLAYTAAVEVASGSANFNPLFIHGSCGVGKTHLLQGICGLCDRQDGAFSWRYVTGEQFTNEFITSLRAKKLDEFRTRYRRLDLLAIDDVHFLSAKKATQDEFLHTFNAIQSAGKRIVMASDAHPRMVGDLNEQLASRFLAGMVVKVEAPDQATRMEILNRRAAAMKLPVAQDVLQYVAMHVRGSVRELEGMLIKLAALSSLENKPVTLDIASSALADHLSRTDSAITLGDIENAAASYFGITPADIHSSRRTHTVSVARMLAMFLARRHTRMSFPEIGKFMGKNHSSVILAVQKFEKILSADGELEWMTPAGPKTAAASKVAEMLAGQLN